MLRKFSVNCVPYLAFLSISSVPCVSDNLEKIIGGISYTGVNVGNIYAIGIGQRSFSTAFHRIEDRSLRSSMGDKYFKRDFNCLPTR